MSKQKLVVKLALEIRIVTAPLRVEFVLIGIEEPRTRIADYRFRDIVQRQRMEHVVVVKAPHPLERFARHPERLTLKELAKYPIVTYESHFSGRGKIDAAFAAAGVEPSIVLEAIDADVIKTYVLAGMGVGIVADLATQNHSENLVAVKCGRHLFGMNTARLAVKQGAYLRGFVYAFIEIAAPGWDKRRVEQAFR